MQKEENTICLGPGKAADVAGEMITESSLAGKCIHNHFYDK